MATKEAFERAWFAQFLSAADSSKPPLPSLSCWDSAGNLRSDQALRDELDRCGQRIAELRQNLRAEEFVELFCQQALKCRHGSGTRAVAKRSVSLPIRSASSETAVHIEDIYSEPVDAGPPRPPRLMQSNSEDLYSEPVDAKRLQRIPSIPEPVYSVPVQPKIVSPSQTVLQKQRRVYEEIDDVRAEKADADDNSSDDESVANLVAIRQSVSRLSQWCVDGDAARKKLEMQAKRLSSRFSTYAAPVTGSGLKNSGLDSVPECLFSPTTPSGTVLTAV